MGVKIQIWTLEFCNSNISHEFPGAQPQFFSDLQHNFSVLKKMKTNSSQYVVENRVYVLVTFCIRDFSI